MPLRADALRRWREESRREKPATDRAAKDFAEADDEQSVEEQDDELATWRDQLLDTLMRMDPVSFEHLAVRLLREAGFTSTSVTGRSHDGGIDGVGTYRMSLLS